MRDYSYIVLLAAVLCPCAIAATPAATTEGHRDQGAGLVQWPDEDAGDPNDRNVVDDAIGDWREIVSDVPATASAFTDIVSADVSVAGASAGAYAEHIVFTIMLAAPPDRRSGSALRYAATLDFGAKPGLVTLEIGSQPDDDNWGARVRRHDPGTGKVTELSAPDTFVVIQSGQLRFWLGPDTLANGGLAPPFRWHVEAGETYVDDGRLVALDKRRRKHHRPAYYRDKAYGRYPFYPGDGDRLPPNTYIVIDGAPVVDRRCAVIVGDDSHGVGPKDAQDFQNALLQYPEWRAPRGLIRSLRTGASNAGVRTNVTALYDRGCRQLVFFYSGHGSNERGDQRPRDENGAIRVDEYLSIRNDSDRKDHQLDDTQRVYDDELGDILAEWQRRNMRTVVITPTTATDLGQAEDVKPEILVVLQACYSGGFVGGDNDLDTSLVSYDILMGSAENQRCYGITPGEGVPVQNSFFADNLLGAMNISANDRRITGRGLFAGADDETTRDARTRCTREEGCPQNPVRSATIDFVLHEP